MHRNKLSVALTLALAGMITSACASDHASDDDAENFGLRDFGLQVEKRLRDKSEKLFGIEEPLGASAPATVGAYRTL